MTYEAAGMMGEMASYLIRSLVSVYGFGNDSQHKIKLEKLEGHAIPD